MTRGQEHCLYIFPMSEFENMLERLNQAPMTSKEARTYKRVFLSGANDQVPDKQGRVTIPVALREYASLEREVAVIGSGAHVEVWDLDEWNSFLDTNESEFADREDELIPGVF